MPAPEAPTQYTQNRGSCLTSTPSQLALKLFFKLAKKEGDYRVQESKTPRRLSIYQAEAPIWADSLSAYQNTHHHTHSREPAGTGTHT